MSSHYVNALCVRGNDDGQYDWEELLALYNEVSTPENTVSHAPENTMSHKPVIIVCRYVNI